MCLQELAIYYKCSPFMKMSKGSMSEKGDAYCEGIILFRKDNKLKVCLTGEKLNVNNSDRHDEFLFQVLKKVLYVSYLSFFIFSCIVEYSKIFLKVYMM